MERFSHNYEPIARKYNLPSLKSIHSCNDLIFVSKCVHNDYLPQDNTFFKVRQSPYSSNRHFILEEVLCRTREVQDSTTHRLRHKWNNVSDSIRFLSDLSDFSIALQSSVNTYE